jgi:hypothetical protein
MDKNELILFLLSKWICAPMIALAIAIVLLL